MGVLKMEQSTYLIKVRVNTMTEIKVRARSMEEAYDSLENRIINDEIDLFEGAEIEDWHFHDIQIIDEMRFS